jgi:hypothetical protein
VEGGTMGEKWPREFCRKWRLARHFWVLLHAFFTKWDRRLYFPSEGRHAEDFFATSRPPKPLYEVPTWIN